MIKNSIKVYTNFFSKRHFKKIYFNSVINSIVANMINMLIVWNVFTATGNVILISLLTVSFQVVSIIFGPICGVFADRLDPIKSKIFLNIFRAFLYIFIAFLPIINIISYFIILFIVLVNIAIATLDDILSSKLRRTMMSDEELITANALSTILFDFTFLLGPLIGGVLFSFGFNNEIFLFNAAAKIISAIIYFTIKIDESKKIVEIEPKEKVPKLKKRFLKDFFEGLGVLKENNILKKLVFLQGFWNMFIWGTSSVFLPVLAMSLGVEEEEGLFYGLLMGAVSVGIIIASLIVGTLNKVKNIRMRKIMLYSGMLHALVFSLIGIPNSFLLVYIIIVISGLSCTPFMIYEYTLIERESPKDKLGRVYSLSSAITNIAYSMGAIISGFVLTIVGNEFLMYVYLTSGLMMFITVIFLGNGLLYNKKEI